MASLLGTGLETLYDRLGLAPHQREGATRTLYTLQRRGGVILADEPGLGKSFIALAVIAEYASAGDRALIICPVGLVEQWTDLLDRFAIAAEVCSQDSIQHLPGHAFRLLVVDEAHHFRNEATIRFRNLAPLTVGARILLITATPLCNSRRDVQELLNWIVADDALHDRTVDSIALAFETNDTDRIDVIVDELMIRRTRDVLPAEFRAGEMRRRVIWHSPAAGPGLNESIASLRFPGMEEHAPLLRKHLHRRLESSHAAFRDSLRRQKRFYRRLQEMHERGLTLSKHDWLRSFGGEDEQCEQEPLFPEVFASIRGSFDADHEAVAGELRAMDHILGFLTVDLKRVSLEQILDESAAESTLVFTAAVSTAVDLHRLLRERRTVALLTSRYAAIGERRASRATVLDSFQRGVVSLLISTDLASEGLNLQRGSRVIHYDLPWTPSRIDQRNGRVWRIGQKRSVVEAIYFLPASHRATGILSILSRKSREGRRIIDSKALRELTSTRRGMRPLEGILWKPGPARRALILLRLNPGLSSQLLFLDGEKLTWNWKRFGEIAGFFTEGDWCPIESPEVTEIVRRYQASLRSALLLPPFQRAQSDRAWPRPLRTGAELLMRAAPDEKRSIVDRETRACGTAMVESATIEVALLIGDGW
ncbi:MAG TPA: DEAD/DEAH box helicase [Thermoanaerobaculia bacterium]|nr:DEAD/DEAH box helicase [Thermoanaerobaculia bacterium]